MYVRMVICARLVGGTEYSFGFGPEYNNFPLDRNVSFFMNMTQGTVLMYIAELSNGTFLTNTSNDPVDILFPEVRVLVTRWYGMAIVYCMFVIPNYSLACICSRRVSLSK